MAPGTDLARSGQNAVLIDVTSLIGAEEFILAQNNHRSLGDPFGRPCRSRVPDFAFIAGNLRG
jgi:hypothetical protein